MKLAKDYRDSAWNILRGRYWWTVLAGLIASVLGGVGFGGSFNFDFNIKIDTSDFGHFVQEATAGQIDVSQIYSMMHPFTGILAAFGGLVFAYAIAILIVGSAVELGYNKFNLSLYESKADPKIETLFSRFSYFGNALLLRLLMLVKIFAWALLFVVPGIIAMFRYSMAPFLMAENPDLSATEAIEESKRLMMGNKWRLFCLEFSFIGWWLLVALTGGVGAIFLRPYSKAAITAFYLDLTGRIEGASYSAPVTPNQPASPVSPTTPELGEGESDSREFI